MHPQAAVPLIPAPALAEAHQSPALAVLLQTLNEFDVLSASRQTLDVAADELARAAARAIGAGVCSISWLEAPAANAMTFHQMDDPTPDSASSLPIHETEDDSAKLTPVDNSCLRVPMRHHGRTLAHLEARQPQGRPAFTEGDRDLLSLLALYGIQSLRATQLRGALDSRLTQITLARSQRSPHTDPVSIPEPGRLARLVAHTFYREMVKAGFGANEIIRAASQILTELSTSLQKHARRRKGTIKPGEALPRVQDTTPMNRPRTRPN